MIDNTKHVPTDELIKRVREMSEVGINQEDIAKVLNIDPKTLRKHYRQDLDESMIKANENVARSLYNKAIDGDTGSMIWWTKARLGWKETRTEERRYVDEDGKDLHAKDKKIIEEMGYKTKGEQHD